jgi:hypothetical protein
MRTENMGVRVFQGVFTELQVVTLCVLSLMAEFHQSDLHVQCLVQVTHNCTIDFHRRRSYSCIDFVGAETLATGDANLSLYYSSVRIGLCVTLGLERISAFLISSQTFQSKHLQQRHVF